MKTYLDEMFVRCFENRAQDYRPS